MYFDEMYDYLCRIYSSPMDSLEDYDIEMYNPDKDENGVVRYWMASGTVSCAYWITTPEGRLIYSDKEVRGYCRKFEDHQRTVLHRHDFFELGYVVRGCATQVFSGKEYKFPAGSVWLSDCNCIHQDIMSRENLFVLFFTIDREYIDHNLLKLIDNEEIRTFFKSALEKSSETKQFLSFFPPQIPSICSEVEDIVSKMAWEADMKRPVWHSVFLAYFARVISILLMYYSVKLTNQTPLSTGRKMYIQIRSYLESHYIDVSLSQLADEFHYSSDFISRILKKYGGKGYSELLQQIRIKKACEKLETGTGSIEEVMESVGYKNKNFFYKIFSDQVGMTPNEYRKQRKS